MMLVSGGDADATAVFHEVGRRRWRHIGRRADVSHAEEVPKQRSGADAIVTAGACCRP